MGKSSAYFVTLRNLASLHRRVRPKVYSIEKRLKVIGNRIEVSKSPSNILSPFLEVGFYNDKCFRVQLQSILILQYKKVRDLCWIKQKNKKQWRENPLALKKEIYL